jgi:hypothetical protein
VKTPEECNANYGANQDVIKSLASGRLLLLGFAQSVSGAAGFKPHGRLSASFGERVIPRQIVPSSDKSTVATSGFAPGAIFGQNCLLAE